MGLNPDEIAGTGLLDRLQQVCELQDGLMTTFLSMVTRASGSLLLRSMLRQTLEGVAGATLAEESSLFWLDDQGYVTESILARGVAIREQKETVVGQVLENGLAGWVYREKKIGVIGDTAKDERWLNLPFQPYVAKSVLCVPIIRGSHLLAIATLMHSQLNFFDDEKVKLMELCSLRLGLVLDLLRIQVQLSEEQSATKLSPNYQLEFKSISQVVLADDGKLVHFDYRLAEIFGYEMDEVEGLNSFFDLVAQTHQEVFAKKVAQCFEGHQPHLLVTFRGLSKQGKSLRIEFYGQQAKLYGKTVMLARLKEL
jgi:PAS domain S-box-containing protein